jgi:hypothetical protein
MTGREIAANLRGTKIPWTRSAFVVVTDGGPPRYCVLGIKAKEHGRDYNARDGWTDADFTRYSNLELLTELNDEALSKEALIEKLESDSYINTDFDIEGWLRDFIDKEEFENDEG